MAAAVVLYMGCPKPGSGADGHRGPPDGLGGPSRRPSRYMPLLQWEAHGWFLYPEHVGHTVTDPAAVSGEPDRGLRAFLLAYRGRNALVIPRAALGVGGARWRGLSIPHGTTQGLLWTVIAALLCFSALNFYSARYILAAMVLLCWSLGLVLAPFLQGNLRTFAAMAVVALVTFGQWPAEHGGHDLGLRKGTGHPRSATPVAAR